MTIELMNSPVAPVEFIGLQSGFGVQPDFELWNTTEPFAGHAKGATLSPDTIHALGYITPKEAAANKAQRPRQAKKDSFTANPWDAK